jgi:hypothetical protein
MQEHAVYLKSVWSEITLMTNTRVCFIHDEQACNTIEKSENTKHFVLDIDVLLK